MLELYRLECVAKVRLWGEDGSLSNKTENAALGSIYSLLLQHCMDSVPRRNLGYSCAALEPCSHHMHIAIATSKVIVSPNVMQRVTQQAKYPLLGGRGIDGDEQRNTPATFEWDIKLDIRSEVLANLTGIKPEDKREGTMLVMQIPY